MTERLLFVVNSPQFFLSHRLPIAMAAREEGYEVHVATARGGGCQTIESHGFVHHELPLSRSGRNLVNELRSFLALIQLFRRVRPSIVQLVTIKPVLYGGVAAQLTRVPAMVAAISGLGSVFVDRSASARLGLTRHLVQGAYRLALRHRNSAVIFQNPADRAALFSISAVQEGQDRLIRGSGVDLASCPCLEEPEGIPVVTIAARLLRDKGVREFVEAARLLRERGLSCEFRLIGAPDRGNPTTITREELEAWRKEGIVSLLGYREDIAAQYAASHLVCLPSYREGLPKSLVEAAACGRAVVTTDVPGCRDAIEPGVSGLLVPPRDSLALADAIEELLVDPERRRAMGAAGRRLAEREFAIEQIVAAHLAIYEELRSNVI